MKRGYSESPSSSSIGLPQSKFKHNPQGDTDFLEDESTKIFARKVADHYSARTNQTLEECEASPIIHLKKLNNWDAVDCPEWIVPFHVFKALAEEYDFELVFVKNNHIFVEEYMKKLEFIELMRRLGALGDGNQDRSTLSPDEWEVAYLYLAFVLKERGQPDQTRRNPRRNKSMMHLTKEDNENVNGAV
ncbi:hypothetical protein K7X08_034514 [Anisodus acutangulus]|uniref:mRNA (guanine-N(7))-methyltransferase n=1 Tax=Anisodus acutangulus TaxID=402998 RepID=A0A9Q1LFN0_9SOLA|nr:hypothetical protein K7X08_034514 [Anisodus acutangulus]